jgi:hypothetical protein
VQARSDNFQSVTDIPFNGKPVGAGLPAMAVCQSTITLNERLPSLASQLPQGFAWFSEIVRLQK